MGSCISKCKPNKKKKHEIEKEDDVDLQDKLVINPPLKSPPQKTQTQNPNSFICPLSPSPSHSSCSSTSFSCNTNLHNSCSSSSSSSSSSSCSSSVTISKDISSISSLKQNPQITLLDPAKLRPQPPQKRPRASSPNLTRQKSFRRDPVGPTLLNQAKKASPLRSPSPSRRFVSNGGAMDYRAVENFKGNGSFRKGNNNTINNVKKGNLKKNLRDPNSRSRRSIRSPSMRKEAEICSLNRVVSRVDGISIREERSPSCLQDVEMLPVEDLNNPLIALDCFIFL